MSNPYIGEIRMFAGTFAPVGWAFCSGQVIAISQNEALFALIGTTYGGDGVNTFNLPDLRSRVPIHQASGFVVGQIAGQEEVTLTTNQIPSHTHSARSDASPGAFTSPAGNVWAASSAYADGSSNPTQMATGALGNAGGGQPHDNMVPFLAVNFIIALFGIFPSRN
jgi:microcystin-dependent protein